MEEKREMVGYLCSNCNSAGKKEDFCVKCRACGAYYCFFCALDFMGEVCPKCGEPRPDTSEFGQELYELLTNSPSAEELSDKIKRFIADGVPWQVFYSISDEEELRKVLRKLRKRSSSRNKYGQELKSGYNPRVLPGGPFEMNRRRH